MSQTSLQMGKLTVGTIPRVVGTIALPNTLEHFPKDEDVWCDIVEVRLDLIGTDLAKWLDHCEAIEARGWPVLLTIRLQAEGGKWTRPEPDRLEFFDLAVRRLTALDVELHSQLLPEISEIVRTHKKILVVSHHDFSGTPDVAVLSNFATKARQYGSIVKVSTMIKTHEDIDSLRGLLQIEWGVPLCIIGMGDEAAWTRARFSAMGSCLTYGYLDKPVAPGQLSARELVKQIRKLVPAYDQEWLNRGR